MNCGDKDQFEGLVRNGYMDYFEDLIRGCDCMDNVEGLIKKGVCDCVDQFEGFSRNGWKF